MSYSLVTKRVSAHPRVRRSPAPTSAKASAGRQSPRGLVPWTLRLRSGQAPVRSSRTRASRCEQSTHPPISSAGKAFPSVRDDICLSRGPDQHPLGGDTAALSVAAPAQKHTGAGSSPGLCHVDNGLLPRKKFTDFTSTKTTKSEPIRTITGDQSTCLNLIYHEWR